MNVDQLVKQFTPYPTIVIPVGKNGYCSHSICVVDNLIFDAITPYALRLSKQSLEWIFGVEVVKLHVVERYMQKCSDSGGPKIKGFYKCKVCLHK